MITCADILNLQLDGVELIAGKGGLNRSVSWTYMVQTRPYEDHMNRGNFALIVVDYLRFDFEKVIDSMVELNALGISGLAISVVNDKEEIPKEVIEKADELELPLFYIRWEGASFVDIAQSIGNLITEDKIRNQRESDYLYNLLFGYEINAKYIEKISGQFGIDFSRAYRVGIIVVDRKYGINLEQDEHNYEHYTNHLRSMVSSMEGHPMFMIFLNKYVLLFEAREDKAIERELERLLRKLDNESPYGDSIRSTCILGNKYSDPREYGQSYQEAKSLIKRKDYIPNPKNKKVLSASAMGIYKFMFNRGNKQEVMRYCKDKLGKLEEYDHANGTYLEDTLVEYYMHGFSNVKTAEALYIHRNSLQHRLDKIEELLGIDITDYSEYLDIINCILVKKIIYM